MTKIDRRLALKFSLAAVASAAAGCGDGGDPVEQAAGGPPPSPNPGPPPPPPPNPPPTPPAAPTTARLSGSAYAAVGVANTYTVTLDAAASAAVTVTWAQTGGAALSSGSTVIATGARAGSVSATWPTAGSGSIDFAISTALTRLGRPMSVTVAAAGSAPLTLAFDASTPHQISINAAQTRALTARTVVRIDYRVAGAGTWIDGGFLYQTKTSEGASANGFAGWILGLTPGTTYDVRLEVNEPGQAVTYAQSTQGTRALPSEGAAQTKACTPATFASTMAGAVAGDVIVLGSGTYALSNFSWSSPGTAGSPVVIRGSGVGTTILVDATGQVLTLGGSYFTFEDMTIRGSQTDSGTDASSMGVVMNRGTPVNATFRRIRFDGCDQGVKVWSVWAQGLLVYDCEFIGNNTWDKAYTIPSGQSYPNLTWNDTGVHMPGLGNCVWNCTFTGFGDTVKLGYQDVYASRACYIHHNWIRRGGDDGVEFDESAGNCAAYNNVICNSASGGSFDGIGGGPVGFIRNICINQTRGPLKFTSVSAGVRILSNTFIATTKQASWDYGLYAASGTAYGFDYRNNMLVYRGANALVEFNHDISGGITDYNAWSPDGRRFHFGAGGSYTGLAAAKAGLAPRMAHDVIVASDPFASPITLGANYTTEYTGQPRPGLVAGSAAKNAGVPLAGVTDGYTGAAPDIGAVIAGQSYGAVGCSWSSFVPG